MGSQDVTARCHPRRSALSVSAMRRPLPAWLSGRCCRYLFSGHRAAAYRDPIRCSRCLQSGHRVRECSCNITSTKTTPMLCDEESTQSIIKGKQGYNLMYKLTTSYKISDIQRSGISNR
jgi:hypothetical protein